MTPIIGKLWAFYKTFGPLINGLVKILTKVYCLCITVYTYICFVRFTVVFAHSITILLRCCVEKCRQRSLRAVQSQDFFRRHEANLCKYIQSNENARTLLENESTWNSKQ